MLKIEKAVYELGVAIDNFKDDAEKQNKVMPWWKRPYARYHLNKLMKMNILKTKRWD